jgi:dephospho-CoA kinase
MTNQQLGELSDKFYKSLKNENLVMPARVVGFSAINGSGKSTISRFLESKGFLNPDPQILRELIFDYYTRDYDERNDIVLKFFKSTHANKAKQLANKSLVIDSNLDRNYRVFFNNYIDLCQNPFIIRIDLPIDVNLERLQKRESNNPEGLKKTLENLPQYIKDHEEFGIKFRDKISYRINTDITEEILEDLLQKILDHKFN